MDVEGFGAATPLVHPVVCEVLEGPCRLLSVGRLHVGVVREVVARVEDA